MVDWNHNGERDSFDFAMDMMAMEEMERASSGRKSTGYSRSMADVSWSEIGCFAYGMFFIVFPVVMAIFFIFMGEGDLFLLTVGLAVALNYAIYRLFLAPPKDTVRQSASKNKMTENTKSTESPKAETSQHETKHTVAEPKQEAKKENTRSSTEPLKTTTDYPRMERMGYYDVLVEHGSIAIKKFTGIDDAVHTVPAIINDFPVRIIETEAYRNCKHIEKLIISEGIVGIRDGAFKGCDKLREVVIPRSANTIGKDAFPHGQDIVIYCYGASYGLDFARQHKYEYRDAEDMCSSEMKSEPAAEPKQEANKASGPNDSEKRTEQKDRYSSGSSSSHSRNTASHTAGYAAGVAASTFLLDDSDDDTDWMYGESTRDRLDFDLLGTGYDSYDLEWMDEDEREEILWDNGLDPFDYDFYDLDDLD